MSSESENEDFLSADEGDQESDNDKPCKNDEKCHSQATSIKEDEIEHQKETNKDKEAVSEEKLTEISDICEQIETVSLEKKVTSNEAEIKPSKTESDILEKNKCQTQVSEQNSDTENITKEIENKPVKEVKTIEKPLKEAKLGMKKPREKLGERLGNKKLGSRITKPLVGISSDSLANQEENKEGSKTSLSSSCEDTLKPQTVEKKTSDDDTETLESSSWGSWGDWGISLAKEVTKGVGSVLETVESTIGVPDAETLAKEAVEREKKALEEQKQMEQTENESAFSFGLGTLGSLVSGVSGALETASNTVLLGGLDTLEKIGRKTMDIIQEGDPGLRRKRAFLHSNKQNLSLVLREARERAIKEEELRRSSSRDPMAEETNPTSVSITLLWDNTEGPAHSEALSLVAKQCQDKTNVFLSNIHSSWLPKLQETIATMKACCCINEDDKIIDASTIMDLTRDFPLPLQFTKIITGWPALQQSLSRLAIEICGLGNTDLVDIQKEIYKEITLYVANVVGVLHKAAEVSLITLDFDRVDLMKKFQKLCSCISGGLEKCADDICESISKSISASDPDFNATITNIYLQMAEANSFMETALVDLTTVVIHCEVKFLL